jgi:branched-chain amino acid transport system substrate-binding protein
MMRPSFAEWWQKCGRAFANFEELFMSKRNIALIAGLMVVLAAVIFFSRQAPPNGDRLRVGAILPLSGRFAAMGTPIREAMDLALEEVNQAGGILGNPVEIIYMDSQGDAKAGVSAAQKLLDVDRVQVLTVFLTGVSEAVKPIAEQRGALFLAQTVAPSITRDTRFTIRMHYSFVRDGEILAQHLIATAKQPIGFIRSKDPSTSYEVERIIIPALRAKGLNDLVDETFDIGNKDFRPQVLRLKSRRVVQVCLLGYGTDFPGALRALNEAEMLDRVDLSGNLGFIELPKGTPAELYRRAVFTAPAFLVGDSRRVEVEQFDNRYRERFHPDRIAYSAYYAHDTLMLLRDVAARAKSVSPDALRKAFSGHTFGLMTGDYYFTPDGDAHPPAVLARWDEERLVPAGPR